MEDPGLSSTDLGEFSGKTIREVHMNPKAMPLASLFGSLTKATADWNDGVLSRTWRKALQAIDADPATAGEAVAVAKARAGTSATLAVQEGVQMHGGMGMTDEFDIGFFMKRARVLQEYLGDSGFHADRLASMRGY